MIVIGCLGLLLISFLQQSLSLSLFLAQVRLAIFPQFFILDVGHLFFLDITLILSLVRILVAVFDIFNI